MSNPPTRSPAVQVPMSQLTAATRHAAELTARLERVRQAIKDARDGDPHIDKLCDKLEAVLVEPGPAERPREDATKLSERQELIDKLTDEALATAGVVLGPGKRE